MKKKKPAWMKRKKMIFAINPCGKEYQLLTEAQINLLYEVLKSIVKDEKAIILSFESEAAGQARNLGEKLGIKNQHKDVAWEYEHNSILSSPGAYGSIWNAEAEYDIVIIVIQRMAPEDTLSSYRKRASRTTQIIKGVACAVELANYY